MLFDVSLLTLLILCFVLNRACHIPWESTVYVYVWIFENYVGLVGLHLLIKSSPCVCRLQWRCCVVLVTNKTTNTAVRFIHPDNPCLAAYDGLVDEGVMADGNKWDDQDGANVSVYRNVSCMLTQHSREPTLTFSNCRGRCLSQGNQCGTLLCLSMDMKVVRVYLFLWYLSCKVRCRELWIIIHLQENCEMLWSHTFV